MDSYCCWEAFWKGFGISWGIELPDRRVIWRTTDLSNRSLSGKRIGAELGNTCHFNSLMLSKLCNLVYMKDSVLERNSTPFLLKYYSWCFGLQIASFYLSGTVTILLMYRWVFNVWILRNCNNFSTGLRFMQVWVSSPRLCLEKILELRDVVDISTSMGMYNINLAVRLRQLCNHLTLCEREIDELVYLISVFVALQDYPWYYPESLTAGNPS